jgi:predicted dithiol-disulfide oxidoreductase (DUF899 family)
VRNDAEPAQAGVRSDPRPRQAPSVSAYWLSDGTVYGTYVTTARGVEPAMAYYALLDRTPSGRDETDASPLWVRRHDEYETS